MITVLDNQSWSKELVTGNGEFIQDPSGVVWVVSNVRADNSFAIFKSEPVPPQPGPGAAFGLPVATYTFPFHGSPPLPNSDFDPVIAYDAVSGPNPLIHIIGTRDNATNPAKSDLVKFTYDTVTTVLTGPVVLTSASTIRNGYDIIVLANGHRVVAVSVIDATMLGAEVPPLFQATITQVGIASDTLTITANNSFMAGQLVTFSGLTTSVTTQALNGLTLQILAASSTQFTVVYPFVGTYGPAGDTGLATPVYTGENLIAFELQDTMSPPAQDAYVSGSIEVVASSPSRSGDTFSSVSLVTPDGADIELYYESHPKVFTFKDQQFVINRINRTTTISPPVNAVWDLSPTSLFTFTGRYTDDRLTVLIDSTGNRYLSQTYWNQSTHPEGIIGNVLLGTSQMGGSPPIPGPWFFHPIFGTTAGGSIIQSTLSISQSTAVSLAYLLEPFSEVQPIPAMGTLPAWPLHITTVDPVTLATVEEPGFYNQRLFTWIRGTKSAVDDISEWEMVGEQETLVTVNAEAHTIPTSGIIQVTYAFTDDVPVFWENIAVTTVTGTPLVEVADNPARGQYAIEPSLGEYQFSLTDAGLGVKISYSYLGPVLPAYISLFNVPPVAAIAPTGTVTVYRGHPLLMSAAGTVDTDGDPIEYFWTENDPDIKDITLAPSGNTAVLTVAPTAGGQARDFTVGVAAVDLFPDNVTPRHPALNVTAIQVSGSTATFTVNNVPAGLPLLPLGVGETVMPYSISLAPPAAPSLSPVALTGAPAQTYYFKVTYLNTVGETVGSAEATITTLVDFIPQVASPTASGDAVSYNVYASLTSDAEQLQNTTPTPLATTFTLSLGDPRSGPLLPTFGTAYQEFLNDQVLTVASPTATTFDAAVTPPLGYTGSPVSVTGSVIPQFQYATLAIHVPFNAPPTITFPSPWITTLSPPSGDAATWPTPVPRNSTVEITQTPSLSPPADLPIVYGGIVDFDDTVTYAWAQLSGTPVAIESLSQPTLIFSTRGANIFGEDLVFQLILSDGVNPPAVAQCTIPVAAYTFVNPDTHILTRSVWSGDISQRNTPTSVSPPVTQTWGAVDIAGAMYSDLQSIKRNSVNDGTDRYIVISPSSIFVYGGINPNTILLRKLFTPNHTPIVDAVHTEADYTLVIDNAGHLFRYSTAPNINTDNPDTTITLANFTAFTFNKIFSTVSFANNRILLLGGPNGLMLLGVTSDTFNVQGFVEISVESNLLYGADNIQFFRTANVESLHSGQVLVGSILNAEAEITNVQIIANDLIVTCQNSFHVGDLITLDGLTNATFLNGFTVEAIQTTASSFQASFAHLDYGASLSLVSVDNSIGTTAVYHGTITGGAGSAFIGYLATITGFTGTKNNGTFLVVGSDSATLTLANAAAVSETPAAPTATLSVIDTGTATGQNDGHTYETLLDLAHEQIIGTWDASKLKNQFVNTGEILFDPDSAYSGKPLAPGSSYYGVTGFITATSKTDTNGTLVTVAWSQQRPDLIQSYIVEISTNGTDFNPLQPVGSGTIQTVSLYLAPGSTYYFRVKAFSIDGPSNYSAVVSVTI